MISFEKSSAFLNSKKSEIVRIKEIKFLDEKIVIKNDISNFCETNNSSSSSLNDSCVEIIKIDEEKEKKRSFFYFEFFVIDFLFDCYQNCQKKSAKKKKKKKMSFETFNQYRKNRSISNESDANLIQNVLEEKELSRSTFREKKAASVTKKIVQFRFSTTISSLQTLQMLSRWLIIMSASKTSKTSLFDEYNVIEFLDWYADLCQNYDLEKKKNSSFVSLLRSYKRAIRACRCQCERFRLKRVLQNSV